MMPLWTIATRARGMRMRVGFGRRAMRRPARVADAGVAEQRMLVQHLVELASLPGARRRSIWPSTSVAMPAES